MEVGCRHRLEQRYPACGLGRKELDEGAAEFERDLQVAGCHYAGREGQVFGLRVRDDFAIDARRQGEGGAGLVGLIDLLYGADRACAKA